MKNIPYVLLGLTLGAASLVQAQTTSDTSKGPHRGGRHGRGGHPIVRTLDTDKDGTLSASELAAAPASLRTLDVNNDGTVSADELRPARPANAPTPPAGAAKDTSDRPHPQDPVMLALDANGDGALSATEINNAAASLAALDANKDGKLTPDELRPLPPAK